ncbi:MAG: discoidin domain-containing protein [Opitutaceae bacterium]|jgi:hypothetical protein|nr:discoidin domain-containing protein [Opitutaceae bacterium]
MRLTALALLPVLLAAGCATRTTPSAPQFTAVIHPGQPGAPVATEHADILSGRHPDLYITSTRASAHLRGHEPHLVIDSDAATDWRVSGPPPAPMVRGNWVEIELNRPAVIESIEVQWLGDARYDYRVYKMPRDDFRDVVREGTSSGGDAGLEKIQLAPDTFTQVVRVEFATAKDNAPQGIRELRINGVPYPAGYPQAADKFAAVETARRILYVEFERLPYVTHFEPKLPYADGGSGLRLLPRDDAFEGGHADFAIAVVPGRENWITLKLWDGHDSSMMTRGNLIAVETLDGDVRQRGRFMLPAYVTDQQEQLQDWNGSTRPRAGRWVYAHYRLPADTVGDRREVKLRLQGVGNVRRDYPMRAPSPTIYTITCAPAPVVK